MNAETSVSISFYNHGDKKAIVPAPIIEINSYMTYHIWRWPNQNGTSAFEVRLVDFSREAAWDANYSWGSHYPYY